MSCKQMKEIALLVCILILTFPTFQIICASVRAETLKNISWFPVVDRLESIEQGNVVIQTLTRLGGRVVRGAPFQTNRPYIRPAGFSSKQLEHNGVPKRKDIANNFTQATTSFSWTYGNVHRRSQSSDREDVYQADFPGFQDVQGEVSGLPSASSPYVSEWLAMRPVVKCDKDAMTFTATGQGYAHLLVDREGASPISLFHLPSSCGFSVKATWQDLVVMASYDGCYITQEDGRHVLPMLWWGKPLKLACPVQLPAQHPSSPTILCSPYGMAVRIHGNVEDIPALAVVVNGTVQPFVAVDCAYRVRSRPTELVLFAPFDAPCVNIGAGPQLLLLLDGHEHALSCPARSPSAPYAPPSYRLPVPPGDDPRYPYPPGPVFPPPPQTPAKKHVPLLPDLSLYPPQELWFPQAYPPPPRPPAGGSPPELQQAFYPEGPGQQYPLHYPYPPAVAVEPQRGPPWTPKAPPGPAQYPSDLYNGYFPFYPPFTQGRPTTGGPAAPKWLPPSHPYLLYYRSLAARPAVQGPPAKAPVALQYPGGSSRPAGPQLSSSYPPGPWPRNVPEACPPYANTVCGSSYYPSYPGYPSAPGPPGPTLGPAYPTATRTPPTTTPPPPPPPSPSIWCLSGRMVAYLPWAHPDSVQVRDPDGTWLYLSSVPAHCGYKLETAEIPGLIFHSPLPSCHTQERGSNTNYLRLKVWDTSTARHRALELQCPYRAPQGLSTPPPAYPTVPAGVVPPPVPMPTVYCSSQKMTVELPPGPVSEIVVKDLQGNHMNFDDADDCGYSSSKQKDGTILLNFPYTADCPLSVQGGQYVAKVTYVTQSGRRELQVSCPVSAPGSSKGCSLPADHRLPCGPGAPSRAQCTSLGCCFSSHPPACYYPMDECSRDHHFVFSVPASLTDPPLSPALLVAAGDPSCKPRKVTRDYALFRIPMDGCGARRLAVGKAVIYVVEIHNLFQSITLNYGSITRDSPIRLLVECRYLPGSVSAGYLVKTPSLGPSVHQEGVFGVQLRIAKDAQYSDYYPQYHQPLQMLLGKPLHLEVRLLHAPDPGVVLLVHYCLAYPRSGRAVWVLLYNGCPNPLDPASQQMALLTPPPGSTPGHTRRFTISTFQFLQDGKPMDPDEEIYFMCSTEVCSPRDGPCVEGCFGQ